MASTVWQHLPIVLITTMLVIAVALELTVLPPFAWAVKTPLALLLGLYLLRVRSGRARRC